MVSGRPSPDTRELVADQQGPPRLTVHAAHRRPLGTSPVIFLGSLALCALVIVLLLLIIGAWIAAIIALGVWIGLVSLFIHAVRHDPNSQAARMATRALVNVTSAARFLALAARAWARAGIALLHIKHRRLRLRGALQGHLTPLGEAEYRYRQARAEELEQRAAAHAQLFEQMDHQEAAIIEGARQAVDREKATTQPTRSVPAVPTNEARP